MKSIDKIKKRWSAQGGYREFLIMAFPLILSTAAWSIQHFVDRVFLTWYSPEAIAAALPAGLLNFALISVFMGAATYASTFVAQYYGAERYHRIGPAVWQGLYISLIGGIAIAAVIPFAKDIFGFFGHDPIVQELEVEYFQVLCIGAGPVIASSALSGFYSGRGKPWLVMVINMLTTGVNLVLDYALIFGNWGFPEMGMRGAALATVIAALFSFTSFMIITCSPGYNKKYKTLSGWRPDRELFRRLLRYGAPAGVQFFLDIISFSLFVLFVGKLGTVSLAATNIAFNINSLAFMPMLGSGIAISVLVGQHLGADKPHLAEKTVYSGFHVTLLYMSLISAAYVLTPGIFIAPFAAQSDPETFAEIGALAVILLRFVAVFGIFDTLNIVFAAGIKGAGDTRFVMFSMFVFAVIGMAIPTYVAINYLGYGLMASWVIVTASVSLLGFTFLIRFLGGRWKSMRVIEQSDALTMV